MATIQWIVAAGTAAFVAIVGFFQWRTAQNKAVLDLFERRHEVYVAVRQAVGDILTNPSGFDMQKEIEFVNAMERAYFFFGDDVHSYLKKLWDDMLFVLEADKTIPNMPFLPDREKKYGARREAMERVKKFYTEGQPLFARYMRFSQTVPGSWWPSLRKQG